MNVEKVEDVVLMEEILPFLQAEAKIKNLNVYIFDNDEVKNYYDLKSETLGVALLAKDEDNARYNLKNLRRCYLIRFK